MRGKQRFVLNDEQYTRLMQASKAVPVMYLPGGMPMFDQQENANAAWRKLGRELGFDWASVEPGSTDREFYALPAPPTEEK